MPLPLSYASAYSSATAHFTPEARARGVSTLVRRAKERGYEAAGAFFTATQSVGVANSLGIFAYEPRTQAECHAVVRADAQGSGYTQRASLDVSTIDVAEMADEAITKAERSRNPVACPLGEYPVVLETYAVAELLQDLAFLGINAQAVLEGRSFLCGQLGKQLVSPLVTVRDDAYDQRGRCCSFDYEGVPKQRVTLFERGVACSVVHDSSTAYQSGAENTGHASPSLDTEGPLPLHLVMETGDASLQELIRGIDHGIYVTRFHYTNPVHPVKTLLTGMTRNGTFLIEHGEISQPLKNMRFTQSILDALRGTQAVGRDARQCGTFLSVVAPAIRLESFHFTGGTEEENQ